MAPQKQLRIGIGFTIVWILLGCAWLCDYIFGDAEFRQLALGELTVLLGVGSGAAMIREGHRRQAAEKTEVGETAAAGTAGEEAPDKIPAAKETADKVRTARNAESDAGPRI